MDLATFQSRISLHHRKWYFGLETVRVYPAPRNNATSFVVSFVKRFELTERQLIQGNGAYGSWDRQWYVWKAEIDPEKAPSFRFKPGDALVDSDGLTWTVLSDDWDKLTLSWHLTCRNIVLHSELRDSITVIRGAPVVSATSAISYNYAGGTTIAANVPARVQPTNKAVENRMEVPSSANRYTVVVAQDLDLILGQDQIQVTPNSGSPFVLKWNTYHNAQRIDELPLLECERI